MSYKIGRYKDDAPAHRGWFVGTFIEDGAAKTEDVEIKYWEMDIGESDHKAKTSSIFECALILSGKCRGVVDGQEITLSAGDYVAIQPGTPSNIPTYILEPATGLCIKAPSDPSAKKEL